jgi:hypothetical protein
MRKISICYWSGNFEKQTGLKEGDSFPFDELAALFDKVLALGLNVMLYQLQNGNIIFHIDDKRFQVR